MTQYGVIWDITPVPSSPFILFDSQRFYEMTQSAMSVYSSLSDYVPDDYVNTGAYQGSDYT